MSILIRTSSNAVVHVEAGESSVLTVVFNNTATPVVQLTKALLLTLNATLTDTSGTVINDRLFQSVKDANNGTVVTDGTLTLKLTPLDNIVIGTLEHGATESHYLMFQWSWLDAQSVTQYKRTIFELLVRDPLN